MRNELLQQLDYIDKQQEKLKIIIRDEQENKLIVTSDKEFDDPIVDPRYENQHYKPKSNRQQNGQPLTVPKKSIVTGFYKGTSAQPLPKLSDVEEKQRERIEKQLQVEKTRKQILRSGTDTQNSISGLNKSLEKCRKMKKEAQEKERERLEKALSEPYRPGFDYMESNTNYSEAVVSNKPDKIDVDYDPSADPAFDMLSKMYISKRLLPLKELELQIGETNVLRLPRLFERLPQHLEALRESNFIVVGVVSEKFEPAFSSDGRSKYIKITLTDFRVDMMLLLYGAAFEKHWKISLGTVVAILNPEILDKNYRSKGKVTGSSYFILRIKSGLNLIEYAKFRDFAICPGLHNKPCKAGVNKLKGRYCPYHQQIRTDKTASNRNEMGTNYRLFAPTDENGNKQVMVVTEKQMESLELVNSYKTHKDSESAGKLAIEKVAKNPPLFSPGTFSKELLITDYSNPDTVKNMRTPEEKTRKNFSSAAASIAFRHSNRINKGALAKQEKAHELDRELMKKRAMKDPTLKRQQERSQQDMNLKKRLKTQGLERMKQLTQASKTDKSLRKDKLTVEAIKSERDRVLKTIEMHKKEQKAKIFANFKLSNLQNITQNELEIQLSSDGDSESDVF